MGNPVTIKQVDGFGAASNIVKQQASTWAVYHAPAVDTLATITKAAETGKQHFVTSIAASSDLAGKYIELVDGTTVILKILLAAADAFALSFPAPVVITPGVSVTLQFSEAPTGTKYQTVAMTGYTF